MPVMATVNVRIRASDQIEEDWERQKRLAPPCAGNLAAADCWSIMASATAAERGYDDTSTPTACACVMLLCGENALQVEDL